MPTLAPSKLALLALAIAGLLLAACVSSSAPAAAVAAEPIATTPPHVLILGDSISIGYTPVVQELLRDEMFVTRPKGNCAGTTHGVQHVDEWLQVDGGRWDLIWFNFGLHDLKRVDAATGKNSNDPKDPRQAEPEVYERQLREIVGKLVATGARLVFATTTPVPPGGVKPYRDVEDPQRYNTIARRVMAEHEIPVCDLFAVATARLQEIQPKVDVHFTKQGSALLAEAVAARVRAELAKR
ncbi:MAG: SGNH/GDSL hydrolase family protein [Planctomycetota bacterium]